MDVSKGVVRTGPKANSTSSVFARSSISFPDVDELILSISTVLHIQMQQDVDASDERKAQFQYFNDDVPPVEQDFASLSVQEDIKCGSSPSPPPTSSSTSASSTSSPSTAAQPVLLESAYEEETAKRDDEKRKLRRRPARKQNPSSAHGSESEDGDNESETEMDLTADSAATASDRKGPVSNDNSHANGNANGKTRNYVRVQKQKHRVQDNAMDPAPTIATAPQDLPRSSPPDTNMLAAPKLKSLAPVEPMILSAPTPSMASLQASIVQLQNPTPSTTSVPMQLSSSGSSLRLSDPIMLPSQPLYQPQHIPELLNPSLSLASLTPLPLDSDPPMLSPPSIFPYHPPDLSSLFTNSVPASSVNNMSNTSFAPLSSTPSSLSQQPYSSLIYPLMPSVPSLSSLPSSLSTQSSSQPLFAPSSIPYSQPFYSAPSPFYPGTSSQLASLPYSSLPSSNVPSSLSLPYSATPTVPHALGLFSTASSTSSIVSISGSSVPLPASFSTPRSVASTPSPILGSDSSPDSNSSTPSPSVSTLPSLPLSAFDPPDLSSSSSSSSSFTSIRSTTERQQLRQHRHQQQARAAASHPADVKVPTSVDQKQPLPRPQPPDPPRPSLPTLPTPAPIASNLIARTPTSTRSAPQPSTRKKKRVKKPSLVRIHTPQGSSSPNMVSHHDLKHELSSSRNRDRKAKSKNPSQDPLCTSARFFNGVPNIEYIYDFVKSIFDRAQFSPECNIIALVFLNRLISYTLIPLHASNWRPLLVCALLISQKVWDDRSLANRQFAIVFPMFNRLELNNLERKFLELIEYDVSISSKLYAKYYFELRTLCVSATATGDNQLAKPLSTADTKRLEINPVETQILRST